MLKKILLLLFLFCCKSLSAQGPKLTENAEVSILTCGRGDQLYSTFGHTALRIKDTENLLDVVYNYGMFDFRTENFYLKFIKGDLQYFMSVTSFEDFIFEYKMDHREVVEQTLVLPLEKKQQLFESLNKNLFSTEKYYTYKFIDRNCTTKVADQLNDLLEEKKVKKIGNTTLSYRTLLYPYFNDYFWYKLGINIIFGLKTDTKATQLFLPVELMKSLNTLTLKGEKVVKKTTVLVTGNTEKEERVFSFLNSIFFVIGILIALVISHQKIVYYSYLFCCGLLGIFLCAVGLYSQHEEVLWNYNALLFNPLFVLLPFVKSKFWLQVKNISLIMILVYNIIMINKPHILIMLPFVITNLYMLIYLGNGNIFNLLTSVKKNRTQGFKNNIKI